MQFDKSMISYQAAIHHHILAPLARKGGHEFDDARVCEYWEDGELKIGRYVNASYYSYVEDRCNENTIAGTQQM